MLPIYKAVAVERAPVKGGSSLPCLLAVQDEKERWQPPHVVKIYDWPKRGLTCREVYGNLLASEFELNVPQAALIEVEPFILKELKKRPEYAQKSLESGFWFGSEYLENTVDWSDTQRSRNWQPGEMELIFAFDVLIQNADRGQGKPNLFSHQKRFTLIDHELSLAPNALFSDYLMRDDFWKFIRRSPVNQLPGHIFYTRLRKKMKKSGVDFGAFMELLRVLRPEKLWPLAAQLAEYEYDTRDVGQIIAYLNDAKRHSTQFHNLLNTLLR